MIVHAMRREIRDEGERGSWGVLAAEGVVVSSWREICWTMASKVLDNRSPTAPPPQPPRRKSIVGSMRTGYGGASYSLAALSVFPDVKPPSGPPAAKDDSAAIARALLKLREREQTVPSGAASASRRPAKTKKRKEDKEDKKDKDDQKDGEDKGARVPSKRKSSTGSLRTIPLAQLQSINGSISTTTKDARPSSNEPKQEQQEQPDVGDGDEHAAADDHDETAAEPGKELKRRRSSSRQRFRPLEFWRGERVVYGRSTDDSTPFECVIDVCVADDDE